MKELVEINNTMLERLENCPNCDGTLKQKNSYRISCTHCGYDYKIVSRTDKLMALCLGSGVIGFGIAIILWGLTK